MLLRDVPPFKAYRSTLLQSFMSFIFKHFIELDFVCSVVVFVDISELLLLLCAQIDYSS